MNALYESAGHFVPCNLMLFVRNLLIMKRPERAHWRDRLYVVIFEADTRAGKAFDVFLLVAIVLSVLTVLLDSVADINHAYGAHLYYAAWFFTILFTVEYLLRLIAVMRPLRYAKSFFGVVDLVAIVPTYISLILPETRYLLVVRVLRLLRVFRVFKLVEYLVQADVILRALRSAMPKIIVFVFTVLNIVLIVGALMYVIEGEENGFTSIPTSLYWAIVTLTTVGYGDISPQTSVGQALAAMVMILGYGIIAVPTGIVTVELSRTVGRDLGQNTCPGCGADRHDSDARHCKFCGQRLERGRPP
jgi:voltage-gated potassium channel